MTPPLNIAGFWVDTGCLGGSLALKLDALREAGFTQVTLQASELAGHPEGLDAAVRCVRSSGLRPAVVQALRDFEGLSGPRHAHKVELAKRLLEIGQAVGAKLLRVGASTAAHASGDPDHQARDLRQLAMLALPLGIRIAYEALPAARHVHRVAAAWDLVCRADMPNLGLGLDALHTIADGTPAEDLELLDPERIFLVQLGDVLEPLPPGRNDDRRAAGPPDRVFPGEGAHTAELADLVLRLAALGYAGDHGFAAAHDDHAQMPLPAIAARARRAAVWLAEDVLRLSAPLPGRMRLRSA